jgi:hypothetical protein
MLGFGKFQAGTTQALRAQRNSEHYQNQTHCDPAINCKSKILNQK